MDNHEPLKVAPGDVRFDTHEKRCEIAANRWPGDKNMLNDRRHVTLTKMNLRNGYAMALKDHAMPMEATIAAQAEHIAGLKEENAELVRLLHSITKWADVASPGRHPGSILDKDIAAAFAAIEKART
jgi:hypothetical protein